jgi:Caspase domain
MRKALVVGINYYQKLSGLFGCVKDAQSVNGVLAHHGDGRRNFDTECVTVTGANNAIDRATLKQSVKDLFADNYEIALFYFAGHGHIESTGGYLCTCECADGDDGVSLSEVLTIANTSPATNKVIVLDSCHSGIAGTPPGQSTAALAEGMTILTASTKDQYSTEQNGSGVFTTLFVNALAGAAANLVGDVTPGSVYAHVDQSLGAWKQRPVFKTNIKKFVSLRVVQAPISLENLRRIPEFFPTPDFDYKLDPTFEPEITGRPNDAPGPIAANTARFAVLQTYNRVNLVVPVGAPHMWHAAMESKSCRLTVLGEHYRRLAQEKLI